MLQDIQLAGASTVLALGHKYAVSDMTVRRDLKLLEDEGLITRTHGGAVRRAGAVVEPGYAAKQDQHAAAKARIADYAARELVTDGDIIILEGGTTTTAMARYLKGKRELTVITNGLYTSNELRHLLPSTTVICTGGMLREVSSTFVGPFAERFLREVHAHTVFLSATGMTLEEGFTDPSAVETEVKKAMIEAASRTIMLLDSSKFGARSLTTVLPVDAPHILVTDEGIPEDIAHALRRRGVEMHIVAY
jgi:DeoR/GlpR family transcriptional regulator of sugar metabolism